MFGGGAGAVAELSRLVVKPVQRETPRGSGDLHGQFGDPLSQFHPDVLQGALFLAQLGQTTLKEAEYLTILTLLFGADGRLSDFLSDDRGHAPAEGPSTAGQRWSTPIATYRRFGPFTLIGRGEARWQAPSGGYPYISLDVDDVAYGVAR